MSVPARLTRRFRLACAGAAAMVALGGCGALPTPAPDDFASPTEPSLGSPVVTTSASPAPSTALGLAAAENAAVRVRNVRCTGLSVGSGFAVDAHTLVTNRHVIEGTRQLQLETFEGRSVAVTTSSTATVADLAVVRTEEELPQSLPLGPADPIEGQPVTVVGYPGGGARTITRGNVVGYAGDPLGGSTRVFVTTAQVQPGSSGSAVLDASGAVVGVVYAEEETTGRSVAVPVSVLRDLLDAPGGFAPLTECTP